MVLSKPFDDISSKIRYALSGSVADRKVDLTVITDEFHIGRNCLSDFQRGINLVIIDHAREKVVNYYFIADRGVLPDENTDFFTLTVFGNNITEKFLKLRRCDNTFCDVVKINIDRIDASGLHAITLL